MLIVSILQYILIFFSVYGKIYISYNYNYWFYRKILNLSSPFTTGEAVIRLSRRDPEAQVRDSEAGESHPRPGGDREGGAGPSRPLPARPLAAKQPRRGHGAR